MNTPQLATGQNTIVAYASIGHDLNSKYWHDTLQLATAQNTVAAYASIGHDLNSKNWHDIKTPQLATAMGVAVPSEPLHMLTSCLNVCPSHSVGLI